MTSNDLKVLLRKVAPNTYEQVAIGRRVKKSFTVEGGGADAEVIDIVSGDLTPVLGSYHHLLRIAPDVLREALRDQPELVVRRLLFETSAGMTASDVQSKIVAAKLDDFDVDAVRKVWESVKTRLDKDDDVLKSKDGRHIYRLKNEPTAFFQFFPVAALSTPDLAPPAIALPADQDVTPSETVAPEESEPKTKTVGVDAPVAPTAAAFGQASIENLDAFLAELNDLGVTPPVTSMDDLQGRATDLIPQLGELKKATVEKLVELASDWQLRWLGIYGPEAPGVAKLLAARSAADAKAWESIIGDAVETLRDRSAKRSDAVRVLLPLATRAHQTFTDDVPWVLIEAAAYVAGLSTVESSDKGSASGWIRIVETCAAGVAAWLRAGEVGDRHLPPEQAMKLARALRAVPFQRTGGRSLLVAELYRQRKADAIADIWWDGADFDQLDAAGHGPLRTAMEDPVIASTVVRNAVDRALSTLSSRGRLGTLLRASAPVARHISGPAFGRALAAVASDEVAAPWFATYNDKSAVDSAQRRADVAVNAQREAETMALRARSEADQLRNDIDRLNDLVRAARQDSEDDRAAHDRQARLDVLRTLANALALVDQSQAARSDAALVRMLEFAAKREDLEVLATAGTETTYDPAQHDTLGASIETNAPVTVLRAGYSHFDGRTTQVLVKAQVAKKE